MEELLRKIIKKCLDIFHITYQDSGIDGLIQFIKFGIVGVSNTVLSYVINVLVLLMMRPMNVAWDYFASNIISFLLSVLWSFYWNNRFVFVAKEGEHRNVWKALLKTYIAYGFTGIILNNLLSWVWVSVLGISKYIAPLINLIVSVPLNFVINKLWAFKTEQQKKEHISLINGGVAFNEEQVYKAHK